jgi:hypothetical protein
MALDMLPIDGNETQKMVSDFFTLSPSVRDKLGKILVAN